MGKPQEKKTSRSAREAAAAAAAGGVDIFATVLEKVEAGIAEARNAEGEFLDGVAEVMLEALRAAVKAKTDLTQSAKAIVVGVLRGLGEQDEAGLLATSRAARALLREAAALQADLAACLKGIVLGAIATSKELGLEREKAATAAANGALEGAQAAGLTGVDQVRKALADPIGGVAVEFQDPSSS